MPSRLKQAIRRALGDRPGAPDAPDAGFDEVALGAELTRVAAGLGDVDPGLAGLLAGLWTTTLRFDAADPDWPDRDRFVVSDGAASPLLFALLHLTGYAGMGTDVLARYGRLHNAASPRPLPNMHRAIEAASALPGQGLAAAVGMALAERTLAARFGRSLVDHRTWVVASAAELGAGLGQEAAILAGRLRLDRLTVIVAADDASEGATGETSDAERRLVASGWAARSVDGTDPEAVASCLAALARARKPTLIDCRRGGGTQDAAAPDPADPDEAARDAVRRAWHAAGSNGEAARRAWLRRLALHARRDEFERATASALDSGWLARLRAIKHDPSGAAARDPLGGALAACRAVASGARGLVFLSSAGSAPDLAGLGELAAPDYAGRHLGCEARDHGMATLANGLASHGGLVPVCASPAIAADRIRPALRLACLTARRLVHLLIGDGLAASSEGAAFQTVEQLASLRAMPNLHVFRPACATEAVECFELALAREDGPSVLMLDATAVDARAFGEAALLAGDRTGPRGGILFGALANPCRRGAYLRRRPTHRRDATLIASGSEVSSALEAADLLEADGIGVAVVSLPCWELFERQPADYRDAILGEAPRFGIEAACGFGWERWLGPEGRFLGLDGFGAAGEPDELRDHFGLTPAQIARQVTLARAA